MIRWSLGIAALVGVTLAAQSAPVPALPSPDGLVGRYLARVDPPPATYRGSRRLEAHNDRFKVDGWLEVTTEQVDARRFVWTIVGEGGSSYIRSKVLRKALEAEQQAVARNDPETAAVTTANYQFREHDGAPAEVPQGLARVAISPKRKDMLLVDGFVWLAAHDGDLLQIDGRLSKNPSFWTQNVDVVRRYARITGVRVPVEMTSVADVRIVGRSTFRMTYVYEQINGVAVDAGESAGLPRP